MMLKLNEWYQKRKVFKNTYNELNRLTNHELADLGLDRGMIENVAREAAYGNGVQNA